MGSHEGGCQLALHGDKLFLYSGHTVVVDKADKTETDLVHDDLWSLDLGTFTVHYPPMQQCSMLWVPAGVTACMQAATTASSALAMYQRLSLITVSCDVAMSGNPQPHATGIQRVRSGPDDHICT